MPLAMPEVELDLSVLEAYEFNVACGHSVHSEPSHAWWHNGDAFYWVRAWHMCNGGEPVLYPLCKPAGDWFAARQEKQWQCVYCHHKDLGRRMVEVIGPINP